MQEKIIAEYLLSIGSLIGLLVKLHGLKDPDTVWSRKSSGLNVITYPITALIPFYWLSLWSTLAVSIANWFTWIGIFLFRSKEGKNERD
jgi:hypothetical protein